MSTQVDRELTDAFEVLAPEQRRQVLVYASWMRQGEGPVPDRRVPPTDADFEAELLALDAEGRRRIAEYVCALAADPPRGVPGHALLRFAGTLPEDVLRRMEQAIEADCERIDHAEW
jgi:hypothetical protein